MLFLKAIEEAVEVWSAKVSYRTEASEQTLARNLLEVTLTDVLEDKKDQECDCEQMVVLTNMVVLRSNLSKNCVMKMWISTRLFTSFSSTSRMISVSHSN